MEHEDVTSLVMASNLLRQRAIEVLPAIGPSGIGKQKSTRRGLGHASDHLPVGEGKTQVCAGHYGEAETMYVREGKARSPIGPR